MLSNENYKLILGALKERIFNRAKALSNKEKCLLLQKLKKKNF